MATKKQLPLAINLLATGRHNASWKTRLYFVWLALVLGSALVCRDAAADDSLAQAYKIIASKRFVDLTHSFSPTTPVWSGFGQATFTAAADPSTGRPYTLEKDSFRTMFFSLPGQYGTHVDPPAHFAEQGLTVDQIPLKQMILPLVVFDVTPLLARDPNHALTVFDVKAWEKAHGQVPAGSFAALRTDMSKDWESSKVALISSRTESLMGLLRSTPRTSAPMVGVRGETFSPTA